MTLIKGPSGEFHAHGPVADYWLAQPGHHAVVTEAEAEAVAEELKGEALDAELHELGLPTTGKADEKRQRVADALATDNTPED